MLNRIIKQHRILWHHANSSAQTILLNHTYVLSINGDGAFLQIVRIGTKGEIVDFPAPDGLPTVLRAGTSKEIPFRRAGPNHSGNALH